MKIPFYKYHGAGNDFIMIDNRNKSFPISTKRINELCNRHFGIGSDGLILLENDEETDFKMVYFNADGNESTMCGNGGRCIVRFAQHLKIVTNHTTFMAIDGLHEAEILSENINLKMTDVTDILTASDYVFMNTGSPHHVIFVNDVSSINVKEEGAKIRYGSPYFKEGTNVNFVEVLSNSQLKIRTYERGVEDETLACGTGVTAAALAAFSTRKINQQPVNVHAIGGDLCVAFEHTKTKFINVWLKGNAEKVFTGTFEI